MNLPLFQDMTPMATNPSTPNFSTKKSAGSGVTLVETLVIVAILGLMASVIGTTLMRWIPQANIKRASRTIVSMYQDARIEAIKRNLPIRMTCNSTSNSCEVRYAANNTLIRFFDLDELQSNVSLTNTFSTSFDSRGRATAGSVTIHNSAGTNMTVTVRSSGSIVTN